MSADDDIGWDGDLFGSTTRFTFCPGTADYCADTTSTKEGITMLILTCRIGETLMIGDNITVLVGHGFQ